MAKAPQITGLAATNVSANYINITWDNLGGFFVYRVERSLSDANVWSVVGSTSENSFYDQDSDEYSLLSLTSYDYRVITTGDGFEESDPTLLLNITTFETNLYSILALSNINPFISFVNGKLINNNDPEYVNFNSDEIRVALTNDTYSYNPSNSNLESLIANDNVLGNTPNPKRYGLVPSICCDPKRTHSILLINNVIDTTLLVVEENQRTALTSINFGGKWDRSLITQSESIGSPSGNGIAAGNDDNTYIIGHDCILSLYTTVMPFDSELGINRKAYNTSFGTNIVYGDTVFADVQFNPELGHRLSNYTSYPAGVANGQIKAITASDDTLYAVANGIIFPSSTGESPSWGTGFSILNNGSPINSSSLIPKIEYFNDYIFVIVVGRTNVNGVHTQYDNSALSISGPDDDTEQGVLFQDIGLYRYQSGVWTKMYGDTDEERKKFTLKSSISRSATDIILSLDTGAADQITVNSDGVNYIDVITTDPNNPEYENDPSTVSEHRPIRSVYYSTDGVIFNKRLERFRYEEQHTYVNGERSWTDHSGRFARLTNNIIQTKQLLNAAEKWERGTFEFKADNIKVSDFNGGATGALIYSKGADNLQGKLIAFYSFDTIQRNEASIVFPTDRVIISALLSNRTLTKNELTVVNSSRYIHPSLEPLLQKMIPEEYIKKSSLYAEFLKEYLKYLSEDNDSVYGTMNRLLWNQDINETELIEKFQGELYQRNIYISEEKRQLVNKFFENRSHDFNSIKGTLDSYRYIFKLLYDVDIEVGLESSSRFEFSIDVTTDNFDQSIIGSTIVTDTGSANVTYSTLKFKNGESFYELTLNNIFGEINIGQTITSIQVSSFTSTAISSVQGKDAPSDSNAYASRLRSYYTVTIKSPIPVGIYESTILKYVHPVGFNFLGVYLIISTISSGLSVAHNTTEYRSLFEHRWSSGVPSVYPLSVPNLDGSDNYKYTNERMYFRNGYENEVFPSGATGTQTNYLVKSSSLFTGGDPYPLPMVDVITDESVTPISYMDKYYQVIFNLDSDARRVSKSPTMDQSGFRFFDFTDWDGSPNEVRLSVDINSDGNVKNCDIASTSVECTNEFNLTTIVTDSVGVVSYVWSIVSGTAALSSNNSANISVRITGGADDDDVVVIRLDIADDNDTDSELIVLSSSYNSNSEAVAVNIVTANDKGSGADNLQEFSTFRTSSSSETFSDDINGSTNTFTSRSSKDGNYAALPYEYGNNGGVANSGFVKILNNQRNNEKSTLVQTLTSQTPTSGGRYGQLVDIADTSGSYYTFISDLGYAQANTQAGAVDIWDKSGANWTRKITVFTPFAFTKLIAFQSGNGFIISNPSTAECMVIRTTNDWSTNTQITLPDAVFDGMAVSYYGEFIVKCEDLSPPADPTVNSPVDPNLVIHKYDGTDYDDKTVIGANNGLWDLSVSINDNGTVFVAVDGFASDAYVYEGAYPSYTKTLLDSSDIQSYGWHPSNTLAIGSSVDRVNDMLSVAFSSNSEFADSEKGGVLVFRKDGANWVDTSFTIDNDSYGINHNLNSDELMLTQGNTIYSYTKMLWIGIKDENISFTTGLLTCNYDVGSACQNQFIFGANARGGSQQYTFKWSSNNPNFAISGGNNNKTVKLNKINTNDTNESDTAIVTLRVTDINAPDLQDPEYYDEDIVQLTSDHIGDVSANATASQDLELECYYDSGTTCPNIWNFNSSPSGGVGGYNINWSFDAASTVFNYNTTNGADVVITASQPAGTSPIVEQISVVVDVEDLGSSATGQEIVPIKATFLENVSGNITSTDTVNKTCNYTSGTCTNSWDLIANPTGGFNSGYFYNWIKVSGDSEITIVSGQTSRTVTVESSSDAENTYSATFKCEVTDQYDSNNVGDMTTFTVNSTHVDANVEVVNMSSIPATLFAGDAAFEGAVISGYLIFDNDGTWEVFTARNGNAAVSQSSGTYTTSSVGADFEILVTASSTIDALPTQSPLNSYITIDSQRIFGIEITDTDTATVDYTFDIREIANTTNSDNAATQIQLDLS
jgi:hypothetical protein